MPIRISKNRVALENIPLNEAIGQSIASASTINLTTTTGNTVHITGTTAITAVTLGAGMVRDVIFDGVLTLTHHATNNNLPSGANITTASNDRARYISDGTTVYCVNYQKADGTAVVGAVATQAEQEAATSLTTMVTPGRQKYHPSAAKAWCHVSISGGTPSLGSPSFNVASLTDEAAAQTRVNLSVAFSTAVYSVAAITTSGTSSCFPATVDGLLGGSFAIKIWLHDGTALDNTNFSCVAFGDQ